jgi:hypothetical protein
VCRTSPEECVRWACGGSCAVLVTLLYTLSVEPVLLRNWSASPTLLATQRPRATALPCLPCPEWRPTHRFSLHCACVPHVLASAHPHPTCSPRRTTLLTPLLQPTSYPFPNTPTHPCPRQAPRPVLSPLPFSPLHRHSPLSQSLLTNQPQHSHTLLTPFSHSSMPSHPIWLSTNPPTLQLSNPPTIQVNRHTHVLHPTSRMPILRILPNALSHPLPRLQTSYSVTTTQILHLKCTCTSHARVQHIRPAPRVSCLVSRVSCLGFNSGCTMDTLALFVIRHSSIQWSLLHPAGPAPPLPPMMQAASCGMIHAPCRLHVPNSPLDLPRRMAAG